MSSLPTIVMGLGSIITLYALLCFLAHYLDFGWKFITGTWLHDDFSLIKRVRSGVIHQVLIGIILAVLLYGGFKQLLGFIPSDWGRVDEAGKFHSYKKMISSILALLVASISMYSFHVADRFFDKHDKAQL